MTHAAWVAKRRPEAPASLVTSVEQALEAVSPRHGASRVESLIDAGCFLLRRVLAAAPASRASALDLLGADACITYAFEAAAGDPRRVAEWSERANRDIGNVAAAIARLAQTSADGGGGA